MTKLRDATDAQLIAGYIKVREARMQRKAAYEAADAADREKQEKIEAEFLRRFHERGTDSTSVDGLGTAYIEVTTSATLGDKDAYFSWILQDPANRLCFLEGKVSKTAVKQYREAHDDIPPGVNWREMQTVRFRRS